jgi:hypothetical protein
MHVPGSCCIKHAADLLAAVCLQGPLAVDAYETHSRVAIEVGDLPELRQCVAVLKQLFAAQPGVSTAGTRCVLPGMRWGGKMLSLRGLGVGPEQNSQCARANNECRARHWSWSSCRSSSHCLS